MQHIRSKNTKPEQQVAQELKRRRIYFAQNVKSIIGTPDFVFRRKKIAVFIDSDFWHGHPKRFIMPQTNIEYWSQKIEHNRKRDKEVNRKLKKDSWKVIRLWEYDIKKNFQRCVLKILSAVRSN